MNAFKTHFFVLLAATCLYGTSVHARTWTTPDGEIAGSFEKIDGEYVVIKTDDSKKKTKKLVIATLSVDDKTFLEEKKVEAAKKKEMSRRLSTSVAKALKEHLVRPEPKESNGFNKYTIPTIELPRYYVFYSGASWCPPCQTFLPKLKATYEQAKAAGKQVEVIYISSDKSELDMSRHMLEAPMPWPGLRYTKRRSVKFINNLEKGGLPCLIVADTDGNVLINTYVEGQYLGADQALDKLQELLELK